MIRINRIVYFTYKVFFVVLVFLLLKSIYYNVGFNKLLPTEEGSTCEQKLKYLTIKQDETTIIISGLKMNLRYQEIERQRLQEKLTFVENELSRLRSLNSIYQQNYQLYNIMHSDIVDLWYYIRVQLTKLMNEAQNSTHDMLLNVINQLKKRKQVLLSSVGKLIESIHPLKRTVLEKASTEVQNKIQQLQNPKNCSLAKKLVCKIDKPCGFGCQFHHIVYCFIAAYATNRTFILNSEGWSYASQGWTDVFQPLSSTCIDIGQSSIISPWVAGDNMNNVQVIMMPSLDTLQHTRPSFIPPVVPKNIVSKIKDFHENPFVWWVGQFVKYLLRINNELNQLIKIIKRKIQYTHPIAAIHVRRTDKMAWREAAAHAIEEYMLYVDEFYDQLQENGVVLNEKKVYIATDDHQVFTEATKKYPNYTFIGNRTMAAIAGNQKSRYSISSLKGLIADIYFLSHADHVVGTFSSRITRLAYELMHSFGTDVEKRFNSLDDVYFFAGSNEHYNIVVHNHVALNDKELSLVKGDLVIVEGNHWDGYSLVRLKGSSSKHGLIPSYKVKHHIEEAEFT